MKKEIQPSRRASSVSEYWFSRKLKEIAALNAVGCDIVSLGIGGPARPPPPPARDGVDTPHTRPHNKEG